MQTKGSIYFIPLAFIAIVFTSCKKDAKICTEPTQIIAIDAHKVDLNLLQEISYFKDTLEKYPFLKVTEIKRTADLTTVCCDFYINQMPVFNQTYSFYQINKPGIINQNGDLSQLYLNPNTTQPKITSAKAVEIAKQILDFSNHCVYYQLGYVFHNQTHLLSYRVYSSTSSCFYVNIDAENGNLLGHDNCIRYYYK